MVGHVAFSATVADPGDDTPEAALYRLSPFTTIHDPKGYDIVLRCILDAHTGEIRAVWDRF